MNNQYVKIELHALKEACNNIKALQKDVERSMRELTNYLSVIYSRMDALEREIDRYEDNRVTMYLPGDIAALIQSHVQPLPIEENE